MLDTLQKMSGTTHRSYTDSKTVTRDMEAVLRNLTGNEGRVSYTMTTREVPVISYNDMAFISPRNSIVFRAGDSPIWNRNETILPMSYKLFSNTIVQPGKDYNLQTIPTLSSAIEFDVRKNQPDFGKMLDKRIEQALVAENARGVYQDVYGYTDYEIEQLDPDDYSDGVMQIINAIVDEKQKAEANLPSVATTADKHDYMREAEANTAVIEETARRQAAYDEANRKIFAGGMIAKSDLMNGQVVLPGLKDVIARAYVNVSAYMEKDRNYFQFNPASGTLMSADGRATFISRRNSSADLDRIQKAASDPNSRVYAEGDVMDIQSPVVVEDAFIRFLCSLDAWDFADGRFEQEMARLCKDDA